MTETIVSPTLVLTLVEHDGERCIHIECKNKSRITKHGFGFFVENLDPKEIHAGKGVIEALIAQPERRGLQGMEFWPYQNGQAKIMAFCATLVPLTAINVPNAAKEWIRQMSISMVERTTDRPKIRSVVLNPREQKALAWLLHATDNGQIVSGFELPNVMHLSGIAKRLGKSS